MSLAATTFRKFAQVLNGKLSTDERSIIIDDGRIKVSYVTGKAPQLRVHFAHAFTLPEVGLKNESAFDRFGKKIGLNKEVQTGDVIFDNNIYVQNFVSEESTLQLLSDEKLRKSAVFILKSGFDRIQFAKTEIILTKRGSIFDTIRPETMRDIVAAGEMLAASIPAKDQLQFTPAGWTPGTKLLFSLAMITWIPLVVSAIKQNDWETVHSTEGFAFNLAFVCWLLSIPLFGRIVRGHHNSLTTLCCACILSLFMYFAAMSSILNGANAIFDKSVSVTHVTKITDRKVLHGKYNDSYFLTVASWQQNATTIEIKVDRTFFDSKASGSTMQVTTKSGAFGWERIVDYR